MTLGRDGIVFGQRPQGIMRVSPNGGTPELIVTPQAGGAHGPQMLPGGETAAVYARHRRGPPTGGTRRDIVVQSLKSGERKTLIDGGSDARYLPTGHLVTRLAASLFAVPST